MLGLLVLGFAGCTSQVSDRLVGQWEGRPDTADDYAARHREAFGVGRDTADGGDDSIDLDLVYRRLPRRSLSRDRAGDSAP